MADHNEERLQPSILDRLGQDRPIPVDAEAGGEGSAEDPERAARLEALARRASLSSNFSQRKLRELVTRDINWLLNTTSLDVVEDLSGHPQVAKSVVNYGVPGLSGASIGSLEPEVIQRKIKAALLNFEPRILKNSLQVHVTTSESNDQRALTFEIECNIRSYPSPEHLHINSSINLETGKVIFKDRVGG